MCVIMLVAEKRPSEEMIEKAWETNDDGGGVAWRSKGEVIWRKGLNLEGMKTFMRTAPLPYVAHFRIASSGGVREDLTHPFPIDVTAPLELEGRTKGRVLFHNGHWHDWQTKCLEAAVSGNAPIPMGAWSDSRGMAWLCSLYGPGILEFINGQRFVVFGPNDVNVIGSTWTKVDDVWCSNDLFVNRRVKTAGYHSGVGNNQYTSTYCKDPKCGVRGTGNLNADGWCPAHAPKKEDATPAEPRGAQTLIPFRADRLIELAKAERLNKEGKVSNKLFKKIRKDYLLMASKDKKEQEKGRRNLIKHSLAVPAHLFGPVH